MNKEELIVLLKSLNLPIGEYYILSGACLTLYGIRDKANDLDLCVSKELFDNILKKKYNLKEEDKNAYGFYKILDNVEIVVNDKDDSNYKFEYDMVSGYPVQKLDVMLRDKKKRNLERDKNDIKMIEELIKKN